jgi:ribonuclease BN (tRNA processing enzyme)
VVSGLELVVLGNATPYPRPNRACSGYLVRSATTTIWVDTGPGTLAELQRFVGILDVDAIWLSHLHVDHCADLLAMYFALRFSTLLPERKILAFGPRSWPQRFETFLKGISPHQIDEAFEVHELGDELRGAVGDMQLYAFAVEHGVPSYALRVEADGAVFTYSADTGPCSGVVAASDGADLLLCEAGWAKRPGGTPGWHMTPAEAGDVARQAGARRLLLTHLGSDVVPEAAVSSAKEVFSGSVEIATAGQTYKVGQT